MKRKTEADLCMEHVLTELVGDTYWVAELRFMPDRMFRFDYAVPERKLAIEIDGGIWTRGRHTRGAGCISDMSKINEAQCLGWNILRFAPEQVLDGTAKEVIKRWLESHR